MFTVKMVNYIECKLLLVACLCFGGETFGVAGFTSGRKQIKIEMPKLQTNKSDTYMCLATSVENIDADVVGYRIDASFGVAHHVSFAVCEDVDSYEKIWDCRKQQGSLCKGRAINVGDWNQWANYKGDTMFSDDIGIRLGKAEKFNKLLLQVHFKEKQPSPALQATNPANLTLYLSEVRRKCTRQMLVFASTGYIPGRSKNFSSEMALIWQGIPVTAVKYFVHTHDHGTVVEGYAIQNDNVTLLGRAAPKGEHRDKRALLSGPITIYPGDVLAARCLFDNDKNEPVNFGMTGNDEMCNFYLDFKYDAQKGSVYEKAVLAQNDAQSHLWCADIIPGTQVLCDL